MRLTIFGATGAVGRQLVAARHDPGEGIAMRSVLTPVIKRVFSDMCADLALMEDGRRDGDLDWTATRLPRLTDGPRTGRYRTAYGQNVRRGLTVSRADVADCMLAVLRDPGAVKQTVSVAN